MKKIRFKPDCREWIKLGIKTTTFRKTRRNGIYEIVEGDIFHPKGLGLIIECLPIARITGKEVVDLHYQSEGDFDSPKEFLEWLEKNKLRLPERGWLNLVTFIEEQGSVKDD